MRKYQCKLKNIYLTGFLFHLVFNWNSIRLMPSADKTVQDWYGIAINQLYCTNLTPSILKLLLISSKKIGRVCLPLKVHPHFDHNDKIDMHTDNNYFVVEFEA